MGRHLTTALLLCSLTANLWLVHANSSLRSTIEIQEGISPGERVTALHVKDMSGDRSSLDFSRPLKGTLLYYFSPNCAWCDRNGANFRALVAKLESSYQIIAYTDDLNGLPRYIKRFPPSVRTVTDDDQDLRRTLKLGGTPETILLGRDGVVAKNWTGAYTGETLKSVESYFRVRLPGLTEGPGPTGGRVATPSHGDNTVRKAQPCGAGAGCGQGTR